MDSITSIPNLDNAYNTDLDAAAMSDPEEEAVPLNRGLINTESTNMFLQSETETAGKEPILFIQESLEAKNAPLSPRTTAARRSNSVRRDPPKILVNRVPPAGIGNINN